MDELIAYVRDKALAYWNETADETEKIDAFPLSVVDFVIEYAVTSCHFPSTFTPDAIVDVMDGVKNSLAMACVDVYAKAGAEGEKSHSENGVTRTYESAWISSSLLSRLPNYVKIYS